MRNIPLMPQGDVFECGLRICPHHARETADLLTGDGIPLMRHRRRTFLFFAEELLSLANLGALQMTNFSRDLIEAAGNHRESRQILSMAITLNYLRRNRRGFQSQPGAYSLFQIRTQMSECAD